MFYTYTFSTPQGKRKKIIWKSFLCLSLCSLWPWLLLVMWHFSARSHIANAVTWMPDGLFAREPEEQGKPCSAPQVPPSKSLPGSYWEIGNWSNMEKMYVKSLGEGWVEFASQNPRLFHSAGKGRETRLGRLSSSNRNVEPHSNKWLTLDMDRRVTGVFSYLQDLTLWFYDAVTMSMLCLWGEFFKGTQHQPEQLPISPITSLACKTSVLVVEIEIIFGVLLAKEE